MGKQTIGTGDSISAYRTKVNNNSDELYDVAMDDPASSLTDTSCAHFAERTTNPNSGVQANLHTQYSAAFTNAQVGVGLLSDVINTGSASGGANPHLPAVVGRSEDTTSGALPLWGVEGKVVSKGTIDSHYPFLGIHQRNKASALGAGTVSIFAGFPEITEADGTTADNTGNVIHFDATLVGTGGDPDKRYALYGSNSTKVSVDSTIESRGTTGSAVMYHTGDSTFIQDTGGTSGHIRLTPKAGAYVTTDGLGIAPVSEGLACGINGFRFDGNFRNLNVSTSTPSSASDTGTTGDIAWDSDYIYVCTATNTWKRTAISTW